MSAMLQFWLISDPKASWQKVVSALQLMDLNTVAVQVSTKYIQPPASEEPSRLLIQKQQAVSAVPESMQQVLEERRNVRMHIRQLKAKFGDVVVNTELAFSKLESKSPTFLIKLCNTLTLLPAHLKQQNIKLLEGIRPHLCKATTVREVLAIMNLYSVWSFANPYLLKHIIDRFGNVSLQQQLESYLKELHEFEKATKVCDFITTWNGISDIPSGFLEISTKLGKSWSECTLDDVRRYKDALAKEAYTTYTKFKMC